MIRTQTETAWNPYFVAFALASGRTPEAQSEHDKIAWPGGRMAGFLLWISYQRRQFYAQHPEAFLDRHAIRDHDAWGRWLADAGARGDAGEVRS